MSYDLKEVQKIVGILLDYGGLEDVFEDIPENFVAVLSNGKEIYENIVTSRYIRILEEFAYDSTIK